MKDTTTDLNILARMLEALGTANDSELARFLGISPQAISKSRASGKIPAPWPLKFAKNSAISLDWLCFGRGSMRLGEDENPLNTPVQRAKELQVPAQVEKPCSNCTALKKELEEERRERRELVAESRLVIAENRQLMKENGELKLEGLKLSHRLDTTERMCREYAAALKEIGAADPIFDEPQIIPSSSQPRR